MRRRPRTDANHAVIVAALRQAGATVLSLASLGAGAPDLCVGYRRRNVLLEIKDGSKAASRRRLTADEAAFAESWQGDPVQIVTDEFEALLAIGAVGAHDAEADAPQP